MAEDSITLKKSTVQLIAVFFVALILGYFMGAYVTGGSKATGGTAVTNPPPSGNGAGTVDMKSLVDDDPSIGSKTAPVVMIEFSDFECPFCGRFFEQTLSQVESEYVDTGKVLFVYRDFPLSSIHPSAQKAAEAAECADEQGKWREMHDKLFQTRDQWAGTGEAASVITFKAHAKGLGLNEEQFNSCLDSGKYQEEVLKDFNDGVSVGVGGTPTFFINGIEVSGAQPFSVFKQVIDQEFAK